MNVKRINRVKFPENVKIRETLQAGDRRKIAKMAGYTEGSINEMLNGYRRLTDEVKRSIVQLIKERKELDRSLEELANQ